LPKCAFSRRSPSSAVSISSYAKLVIASLRSGDPSLRDRRASATPPDTRAVPAVSVRPLGRTSRGLVAGLHRSASWKLHMHKGESCRRGPGSTRNLYAHAPSRPGSDALPELPSSPGICTVVRLSAEFLPISQCAGSSRSPEFVLLSERFAPPPSARVELPQELDSAPRPNHPSNSEFVRSCPGSVRPTPGICTTNTRIPSGPCPENVRRCAPIHLFS
jgi:hypothetical protein